MKITSPNGFVSAYFDLRAAARSLRREAPYKKFSGLVERVSAARSIHADLERASSILGTLSTLASERVVSDERMQDEHEGNIEGGLFVHSLVLYTRATHSSSKHRVGVDFTSDMIAELKQAHDMVVKLRNDSIAHFGPADNIKGGFWAKDTLHFVVNDNGGTVESSWQRVNNRQHVVTDLGRLVPYAIKKVLDAQRNRSSDLLIEMQRLFRLGPDFLAKLERFRDNGAVIVPGTYLTPALPLND